jgi:hypothetical protein
MGRNRCNAAISFARGFNSHHRQPIFRAGPVSDLRFVNPAALAYKPLEANRFFSRGQYRLGRRARRKLLIILPLATVG